MLTHNTADYSHIGQIFELYYPWWAEEELSAIVTIEEVIRNDYNLNPSRYISADEQGSALPLEETLVLLAEADANNSRLC